MISLTRPMMRRRPDTSAAWSRLATIARLAVTLARVITNLDVIERWQSRLHFQMHRLDRFTTLFAAADIGLAA